MRAFEKVSLSLPEDLYEAISKAAQDTGQSRSQTVAELLRMGLSAGKQIDRLYRENARLNQALEETSAQLAAAEERLKHPPIDPSDFLTGAPPGTGRLRRDLDCSERTRRQAEADAAEARRHEEQLRVEVAELGGILAAQEEEIASLRKVCRDAEAARTAAEEELVAEKAQKAPWYWRLTLPHIRFRRIDVAYSASEPVSWRRGFLACALLVGLILFLSPHESKVMRYTAVAAMGTWGDTPLAAARLHGGPIMGRDTLLQIHALVRAGRNPERLDACFDQARKLNPDQPAVSCTIRIPREFELYADTVMSGPHARTSQARSLLERQRAALDRLDKGGH